MKIGMDISQTAHTGGVSMYTEQIASRLANRKDLEMVFFYSSLRKPFKGKLKNVKNFRLPPTLFEVLFNKMRNVSIESFIGEVDIFHSSDWVQPPTKAKKVTTYHDVIPLKFPHWSHPKIVEVHKRRLEIVEKEVDMVIAVSENTKKDLLEVSKIPEEKIKVIYSGVDERFSKRSEKEVLEIRRKYNLPEKFILASGGVGERKNLNRIKQLEDMAEVLVLGEGKLKDITNDELPLIYSSATVLVFASLYEGFGMPILEAMACETPVVTSNVSSMPEVGGDACLYIDPLNFEDIREKTTQAFSDQKLRKELVVKGLERVKGFNWDKTVEELVKIYKGVIEQ